MSVPYVWPGPASRIELRLAVSRVLPLVLAAAFVLTGCGTSQPAVAPSTVDALRQRVDSLQRTSTRLQARADSLQQAASLRHPALLSTLWTQTAVEYDGVTRSAYELARLQMSRALADSVWTASVEQSAMGSDAYRTRPPAVVLDVDETVLDNAAYQARLIRDDETFGAASWTAWCRERAAGAVPGALAFVRAAVDRGVQVIYLTNRDAQVEAATRDNLQALGFPVDDAPDAVLTRGERAGWEPKSERRRWVAERYRILLLIGDNVGDFVASDQTLPARDRLARTYDAYWGTRWIVLPNPQYGSWRDAITGDDALPPLRQLHIERAHLNPKRDAR